MPIFLRDVTFSHPEKPLFRHLTLTLPATGIYAVTGPSGCGKTTFLRLLAGLEQPQEGVVDSQNALFSMIFQENRLLPWRTALDNVRLFLPPALPRREASLRARAALASVGLEDAARLYPASLSGGMARRTALARALAAEADILLLDEPFAGLDADNWRRIAALIAARAASQLVLTVTHSEAEAHALGATLWHFDDLRQGR